MPFHGEILKFCVFQTLLSKTNKEKNHESFVTDSSLIFITLNYNV